MNGACGEELDATGDHALRCLKGGGHATRHNAMRDLLATILRDATGAPVEVEQQPGAELDDDRRPDMVFYLDGGQRRWGDVTVVAPSPQAIQGNLCCHRDGALAERAEQRKRVKYAELNLVPMVWENRGRIGPALHGLMATAHRHLDTTVRSVTMAEAWQSLSATLMRGNTAILAAAGPLY